MLGSLRFENDQLSRTAETQEVYNRLKEAGVDINSEAGQAIQAEVHALFEKERALQATEDAQKRVNDRTAEFASMEREALGGFLKDIKNGVAPLDALSAAVGQLTDRLLDMALDAAFSGGGFGIFAGIGSLFGFDEGGYTGNAGTGDVAGVVHGKEFVVNASATAKNRRLLEAINSGRVPGYAGGGFVGSLPAAMARVQPVAQRGGDTNLTLNVNGVTDARGFRKASPQLMAEMGLQAARMVRRNG